MGFVGLKICGLLVGSVQRACRTRKFALRIFRPLLIFAGRISSFVGLFNCELCAGLTAPLHSPSSSRPIS